MDADSLMILDEMKAELFDELVESVREGGAVLRGECEPARMTILGIPVQVHVDSGRYFVSDDVLDLYGTGDTLEGACDDYRLAAQDAYADLSTHADRLAPYLEKQLDYLRQIFGEDEKTFMLEIQHHGT